MSHYEGRREVPRRQTHEGGGSAAPRRESSRRPRRRLGAWGALLYVVIANKGRLGRLSSRGMAFMVVLSLYFGLTSSGVDNWAHIGGLVCGIILSVLLYRPKAV